MLHQACCPPESFHPSCTALFTCSRLCLWWRGTLAVALGAYLPSDLSSLRQNPRGKRWLLLWELLGDQCPGDGVAADNNLCSSSSSSNFQHLLKHILHCFCHTLVSSEDRSLNKCVTLTVTWRAADSTDFHPRRAARSSLISFALLIRRAPRRWPHKSAGPSGIPSLITALANFYWSLRKTG